MSLLGNVLGGLLGSSGGNSGLQNVLMNVLGGQQGGGPLQQGQAYSGPAASGQGPAALGQGGGLGGLVSAFSQAGLGNIIQSWVGQGPNEPVSPGQLTNVFGQDQVQTMASQAGMSSGDFLSQLSQHLPRAVDGMTPNGRLPNEGTVSV